MAVDIQVRDLQALQPQLDAGVAQRLIDGTVARAAALAPCILAEDFPYTEAAQAIICDVILRRAEAGLGVVQSETAGPMSRTFFPAAATGRALFLPGEIAELQALCTAASAAPADVALPTWAMPPAPGSEPLVASWRLYPGT